MLTPLSLRGLLTAAGAIALAALVVWAYASGHSSGSRSVQERWDTEKTTNAQAIKKATDELDLERAAHASTSASIDERLLALQRDGYAELDRLRGDYADRLRVSEARAERYRSQAASGPDQCSRLASHAARLDQSLEEGRHLVEELQGAIRQRDAQLKLLGEQIITDRELLNDKQ